MKKIITLLLSISFLIGLSVPMFAAEAISNENGSSEIMPNMVVLQRYNLSKAVKTGNTISATAYTQGKANATSSYVRIDLYRKANGSTSYTLWKSGTTMKNSSGGYIQASETWSTVSGYTYKVVSTHTAYAGSTKETKKVSKIF